MNRQPQPLSRVLRPLHAGAILLVVLTAGRLLQRNGVPAFPPRTVLSNVSEAPPAIVSGLEALQSLAQLVPPGATVMAVEPERGSFEFILYAMAFARLPGREVIRGRGAPQLAAKTSPEYIITIGAAPLRSPDYKEVAASGGGRLYVRTR